MLYEDVIGLLEEAKKQNLTELDLSNTEIEDIPSQLWQITSINYLNLSHNRLKKIPKKISKLCNLQWLVIDHNKIENIPACIFEISTLQIIIVCNNQLKSLPRFTPGNCNIRILDLSHNYLSKIPKSFTKFSQLEWLDVSHNQITVIPSQIKNLEELATFKIADNQLSKIPTEIKKLKSLQTLDFRKNPKLKLPDEILNRYWDSEYIITRYFREFDEEKKLLNEIKLIVVGDSNAGKTSLIKLITNNGFNSKQTSTRGVDIIESSININNQDIQLNIWDFSGQDILFDLHQLFLTKNSLYLLVLNSCDNNSSNKLHNWLKKIKGLGASAPIMIVGNKSDEFKLDINKQNLKNEYQNIQNIFKTSCKSGEGIEELRKGIKQQISSMKYVSQLFPLRYFDIKEELQALMKRKNYLSLPDYKRICNKHDINNDSEIEKLLTIFHELGIVINFNNQHNSELYVLSPDWIVKGAYKILNDHCLKTEKQGLLSDNDTNRIFRTLQEPSSNYRFRLPSENNKIVKILAQHNLLYKLEDKEEYMIPALFPQNESNLGEWRKSIQFQLRYKSRLPLTIFFRFITKIYDLIYQNRYWQTGVILIKDGAIAYVQANLNDNIICVRIAGNTNTRRSLLSIIHEDFNRIHKSIDQIEVEKHISSHDQPEFSVDYQYLLRLEELKVEKVVLWNANKPYSEEKYANKYHYVKALLDMNDMDSVSEDKRIGTKNTYITTNNINIETGNYAENIQGDYQQ